jgi:hypothetical protein
MVACEGLATFERNRILTSPESTSFRLPPRSVAGLSLSSSRRILEHWELLCSTAIGEAHQWAQAHFFVGEKIGRRARRQVIE